MTEPRTAAGKYEHLTDEELARDIFLHIVGQDDNWPDAVVEAYAPAYHMAVALRERLRGPYCNTEGCRNEHMASFPWCPWHRPEAWGPLPADFPPNPNPEGSK